VPAADSALAGIVAVSCVAPTKVVGTAEPFHVIPELAIKFEPFTVTVNELPPATALEGERDWIAGTGFVVCIEEPPPPQEHISMPKHIANSSTRL
jgi:hypothetical protein